MRRAAIGLPLSIRGRNIGLLTAMAPMIFTLTIATDITFITVLIRASESLS
jgi:hypothetical protein